MKLKYLAVLFILSFIVISCVEDDDINESLDSFYTNIDRSASISDLAGIWSIYNIGFQGVVSNVPENYQECGRDFVVFSENGLYSEYLFPSSACNYDTNTLNFELRDGIIIFSNQFDQFDEWVITKLNADQLTAKARFDVDEDGILDVVTLYLQHYLPAEIDMVTHTFTDNRDEAHENLISFIWQPYAGFNTFERYEIFRTDGNSCNLANAELIATITDVNLTEFTDLTPPALERLCYYLKVYTSDGLLGESYAQTISTYDIYATSVTFNQPVVLNNAIQFTWEPSEDPYFSHYELAYSNFANGTTFGQQEHTVALINDVNTLSFIDEVPPYLKDPYYILYVHNIFGKKSRITDTGVYTHYEVPYARDEMIDLKSVESYAIDYDEPVVYFYGKPSGSVNILSIYRYNYNLNETQAETNYPPQFGTNLSIKLINSGYGKEIIVEQASDLFVYNAETLAYKYTIDTGVFGLDDFIYTESGFWVLINNNTISTFTRDNANFELIDTKPHFPNSIPIYRYHLKGINNNKVLVGHQNESSSYVFNVQSNGMLNQEQIAPIPILSKWESASDFNVGGNYIINYSENRLYSTTTFSFLESFEAPYFPTGTSLNGNLIFGSNNDPSWQIDEESIHAKQAVVYNRATGFTSTISTIGYPQLMFEINDGTVMSLSSGLKKNSLGQNIASKADLFFEVVDIP